MSVNEVVVGRHRCAAGKDEVVEILVVAGVVGFDIELPEPAGSGREFQFHLRRLKACAGVISDTDGPGSAGDEYFAGLGARVGSVAAGGAGDNEFLWE